MPPPETPLPSSARRLAARFAESPFLRRGKKILELNFKNWNLPLSKLQKIEAGLYLILRDYARGHFPPRFDDRAAAYQGEIDYANTLPGVSLHETYVSG